jgi:hypothetical protein
MSKLFGRQVVWALFIKNEHGEFVREGSIDGKPLPAYSRQDVTARVYQNRLLSYAIGGGNRERRIKAIQVT